MTLWNITRLLRAERLRGQQYFLSPQGQDSASYLVLLLCLAPPTSLYQT